MRQFIKKLYHRLPLIAELDRITVLLSQIIAFQNVKIVDFELANHSRYNNIKRLTRYEFKVNSQNGEDGIINEIFKRIGVTNKVFVEIGVGDGTENNTAFLLSQGWTGFWVDGFNFIKRIRQKRQYIEGLLKGRVSYVTRENINQILNSLNVPEEFDLLSVDIDQNTYYIWENLKDYKPRVAVIEYNASIPPDCDWKAEYDSERTWDGSINYGAGLKALEILGKNLGYCLVGCDFNGVNAFFVRQDLVGNLFEGPFTAENHYEPFRMSIGFNKIHRQEILD